MLIANAIKFRSGNFKPGKKSNILSEGMVAIDGLSPSLARRKILEFHCYGKMLRRLVSPDPSLFPPYRPYTIVTRGTSQHLLHYNFIKRGNFSQLTFNDQSVLLGRLVVEILFHRKGKLCSMQFLIEIIYNSAFITVILLPVLCPSWKINLASAISDKCKTWMKL